MAAHKPLERDTDITLLDNFAVNGGPKFPKADFNCINRQYPASLKALKGINTFERANEHLKIGDTVLQYDTDF